MLIRRFPYRKRRIAHTLHSIRKNLVIIVNKLPFDLQYIPDFIFYTKEKAATVFPNYVGSGQLFINPCFSCNFTEVALIVDNYLLQFDANGIIHILDIVKNSYQTLNINKSYSSKDSVFQNWILQIAAAAPKLNKAISSNQRAYKYMIAFTQIMYHHTCQRANEFDMCYNFLRSSSGGALEIRNRTWYWNGEKISWGQVAHILFRNEKAQLFDLHSL